MKQKLHIYFNEDKAEWLAAMEARGVSRSSIVNLALDILIPRTGNIKTTDVLINSTIAESKLVKQELEY